MTKYLLDKWKEKGQKTGREFIASTIVSTPLMQKLAQAYGVEYKEGLTGFKWIAKMIKDFPDQQFIGGGEESFGYMVGDFVRDKDAETSALLAMGIAAEAKAKGSSFFKEMLKMYQEFGLYQEHLISIVKKGISGAQEINQIMKNLRENPVKEILGEKVVRIDDYQTSVSYNPLTGEKTPIEIPKSNVLIYNTEKGLKVAARPSGTEPKIKFYFSANAPLSSIEAYEQTRDALLAKIKQVTKEWNL
jgi:phosphoglucomutase/phosphomannomutase family protein